MIPRTGSRVGRFKGPSLGDEDSMISFWFNNDLHVTIVVGEVMLRCGGTGNCELQRSVKTSHFVRGRQIGSVFPEQSEKF